MNTLLSQPSFLTLFCYDYVLLSQSFILRLFCYEHTVLSQPPICTLFCYEHSLLSQPSILTLLCTSAPVNRHPLTSRCDIKQLGSLGPVLNMTKVSQQTESVSMGVLLNIYQQNFKCEVSVSVIYTNKSLTPYAFCRHLLHPHLPFRADVHCNISITVIVRRPVRCGLIKQKIAVLSQVRP